MNANANRVDLYRLIHKGLRAAMSESLLALGRLDADDAAERRDVLQQLRELLFLCRSHLEHENRHVHTALEARRPGSSAQTAGEHRNHVLAIDWLEQCVREVEGTTPAARGLTVHQLYHQLALFVAENLEHMHDEETRHNAVLWEAFSDAELTAIHDNILASLTPQERMLAMRWMLPAVTPAERAQLLASVRDRAPAPVFEGLLAMVRKQLAPEAWSKLARALELPLDLPHAVRM